jgi:RNA polymerase sigma-70 factor, ECF subfamily
MIEGMDLTLVMNDATMAEGREGSTALPVMSEDEFRSFYERTARPLWAYLARITGDRQQADELLQEAYYRFVRMGARHEDESHRRNSLFRIATNVARDAARHRRRWAEVPIADEESMHVPRSTTPMPEQEAAVRTDLARAMRRLDPAHRELLWLAYAQGASHEEIAAIVGVRAISVRTLLLRARRKLAAMLAGSEAHR